MAGACRLQGTYEWARGRRGRAQKLWMRSLAVGEELGARYDVGVTDLEMGRRLETREHLERAEALFTELGAEWDLAKARQLFIESGNG